MRFSSLRETQEQAVFFAVFALARTEAWRISTRQVAEKMMADLDDETVYKIVRGNAIRMLELDLT